MRDTGLANALMGIELEKDDSCKHADYRRRVVNFNLAKFHEFDELCFPDLTKYDKARWKTWMGVSYEPDRDYKHDNGVL